MSASEPIEARIAAYLGEQFGAPVELHGVQRIAVGWSHETWLFDAAWTADGVSHRQGLCLRRDPGNALLREMSDLGTQFTVLQALARTAVPAPKAYFYESDPAVLDAPFLVMEKVPGTCPSPWGRDGQAFYRDAAARGVLPLSFTDALITIHTADWQAAGLDVLGVPGRARASSAPSWPSGGPSSRRRASSRIRSSSTCCAGWRPTCRRRIGAPSSTGRTAPATC